MSEFSKRLIELRKVIKLTQLQMAECVNVSRTTYSSWEQGKSKPDLEVLVQLCKTFKVSSDYLLGISDSRSQLSLEVQPSFVPRDPLGDLLPEYRQQAESYLVFLRQQQAAETAASDKKQA